MYLTIFLWCLQSESLSSERKYLLNRVSQLSTELEDAHRTMAALENINVSIVPPTGIWFYSTADSSPLFNITTFKVYLFFLCCEMDV